MTDCEYCAEVSIFCVVQLLQSRCPPSRSPVLRLGPLVKRLTLCEELDECPCGDVLFHGYLAPPPLPMPQQGWFGWRGNVLSINGNIPSRPACTGSVAPPPSPASTSTHSRNLSEPPVLPSRVSHSLRTLPTMESKFQVSHSLSKNECPERKILNVSSPRHRSLL